MDHSLNENEFLKCLVLQFVISVAFELFLTELVTMFVLSKSKKRVGLIVLLVLLFTKNSSGLIAGTKPSTTLYRNTSLWLVLLDCRFSSSSTVSILVTDPSSPAVRGAGASYPPISTSSKRPWIGRANTAKIHWIKIRDSPKLAPSF